MNQREQRAERDAFVPMVEGGAEWRLAPHKGDSRTQDDGHPKQGSDAPSKANAAERGKPGEEYDAGGKARNYP